MHLLSNTAGPARPLAALLFTPEDYPAFSEQQIDAVKELGSWGQLGPSITKAAFVQKKEVRSSAACCGHCVGSPNLGPLQAVCREAQTS